VKLSTIELKADVEEMKGEAKAKIENAEGEAKALKEEAKGNKGKAPQSPLRCTNTHR
jgi:hypothetical protein